MTTDNCSDCCIITPENYPRPGFIPGFGGLLLPSHSIVPASGQLTLSGLGREKVNDNYASTASISNVSLRGLAEGVGYDGTTTSGPNEPNASTPHAMSEWHGYDHDYVSASWSLSHGGASGSWNGSGDYWHYATVSVSAPSTNTHSVSFSVCLDRRAPHSDNLGFLASRPGGSSGSYSHLNWSGSVSPGNSVQRDYQWGKTPHSSGYHYGEVFLGYTTASGSCSCNSSRFSSTHT